MKQEKRILLHPYLMAGIVFECFFYLPLGVYLYYFYPAWSWMYFLDPGTLSPFKLNILGVIMVSGYLLCLVFGFQLAQFFIRQDQIKLVFIILGVSLLGLGIFSLFNLNRLLWVSDYQGFQTQSNTIFLLKHRLFWLMSLMAILGLGSLAMLAQKLKTISMVKR